MKEFADLSSVAQNAIVDAVLGVAPNDLPASVKDEIREWAELSPEDLWSCFTCDYVGLPEHDPHYDESCCPQCGTHEGDGFGMLMNDPRYKGQL